MSTAPMQTPAFFEGVPRIRMQDGLAHTLGAVRDGIIDYSYLDAVKLCGHSCPTVAGAWLMTNAVFGAPIRGDMRFTRLDSGEQAEVSFDPAAVPRPQELKSTMQAALAPQANAHRRPIEPLASARVIQPTAMSWCTTIVGNISSG